jgi:hypothetical protein
MRRLLFVPALLLIGCPSDVITDDDDAATNDTAPTIASVTVSPSPLHTDDLVSAIVSASDPEGDPITASYTWFVDDEEVVGATNPTLDGAEHFDKGQMVSVSVVATAGALSSDPMRGADVEVLNSAPTTPAMGIEPNAPATIHDLVCRITTDSIDDDGDEVIYTLTWTDGTGTDRSSEATATDRVGDTIAARTTVPGEAWTCEVLATDGTDDAPPASANVVIAAQDLDGDGSPAGNDCDDLNAAIFPGAPDACDGWDNDCDNRIEEFVGWWSFDGDGVDGTGSGNNLSMTGNTAFVAGVCGQGLELNQAQASVLDPGSLSNFYGARGLTVALWGRPIDCTVGGGDAFCPYVSKGGSGAGAAEEYTLGTDSDRDRTFFNFQTGDGAAGASTSLDHAVTQDWHNHVVTYDPTGFLTQYRDGQQVDQTSIQAIPHAGGDVTFGTNPAGGLERGHLEVDEAFIANCSMPPELVAAHFDCGGCGCRGGVQPCGVGEFWTGIDCAPTQ